MAACAGSAIEWYGFYVYLTAVLIFPTIYFPAGIGVTAAVLTSRPRGGRFAKAARSCWRRAYTEGRNANTRR